MVSVDDSAVHTSGRHDTLPAPPSPQYPLPIHPASSPSALTATLPHSDSWARFALHHRTEACKREHATFNADDGSREGHEIVREESEERRQDGKMATEGREGGG